MRLKGRMRRRRQGNGMAGPRSRWRRKEPERWRGKRILFWHTGGLLGMYAAAPQLGELMPKVQRIRLPKV